jgi:hypothetical protein
MSNFFRNSTLEKPAKNRRCPCSRCGGSGIFYIHGTCFRCGGSRVDPTYLTWAYPAAWTDEQCQAHVDSLNAKNAAARDRAAAKKKAKTDAIYSANVARCPALARLADDDFRGQFDGFVIDIRAKSFSFALSDRQADALTRAVEAKEAFIARRDAQKAEAIANAKPCPAGRVEIEGDVLSIKEYPGDYGIAIKCLLQCDGYKLFGTLPASLVADAKVGDRISLTATVKEKEAGFGTYSRPTGGEILVPVTA